MAGVVVPSYLMEVLVAIGVFAVLFLLERRSHAGVHYGPPATPVPMPPRPPGMPPPAFWPSPAPGPGALAPPPVLPAAPGPPSCVSDQWHMPTQPEIPPEVKARAIAILHSPMKLGDQVDERWAGRVWRFKVETHGANDQIPTP